MEECHAPLRPFMSWRYGRSYGCDHDFTKEESEFLTSSDFYRLCKFHIFGEPDANEGVSPPLHYCLNTMLAFKQAISYSMVNNDMQLNETAHIGNPT
jgi:hypothetical protein